MPKRTVILYSSATMLTHEHQLIHGPRGESIIYVRVEAARDGTMPIDDLSEALDHAKPMPGETVLNSIHIDQ